MREMCSLPDPLIAGDGTSVESIHAWRQARRPEILDLFATQVYGHTPDQQAQLTFTVTDEDHSALDGNAIRKQVTIKVAVDQQTLEIDLLIYLPHAALTSPAPIFTFLNFGGNHTIHADPTIKLPKSYINPDQLPAAVQRGAKASRFIVEQIVARGYGLATIYHADVDPDFDDGFQNGLHPLLDGPLIRTRDAWGSIGAWAWALSRAMDYFETDDQIDQTRVAVGGHSRLGKTALWAGAQDQRFAVVISNNSGCTGAAISRGKQGETIEAINREFPHWFCHNYRAYNRKEDELPVDQHMLLGLIAPRPLYVCSSTEDEWADPVAEFNSCVQASPVYQLFGQVGIPSYEMPTPDEPLLTGNIGYHLRTGKHDLTAYDWRCFMDFADRQFKAKA